MSDMTVTTVRLDELYVTPLLQTRIAGTCKDTVNEYATAARDGAKFPPLLAYRISDRGFKKPALVAGFHRYAAYQKAGITECEVEIRDGTLTDAWLAGWASNLTHGLRYKSEDKRKAAVTALKLYREDSAPVIAERIGVSDEFIRKVRKGMVAAGQLQPTEKIITRDGRSYPASLPDSPGPSPTVGDAQADMDEDQDDEPAPNAPKRARKKLDTSERVERALRADPTRTDEQIALGTKADVALVASAREALRQKGEVPPAVPELDTWGFPFSPTRPRRSPTRTCSTHCSPSSTNAPGTWTPCPDLRPALTCTCSTSRRAQKRAVSTC